MSGPCDNRTDSAVRARFSTTRLVWSCLDPATTGLTRLYEPDFYHTPCVVMSGPCVNRTDSAVRARFSTTLLVWSCLDQTSQISSSTSVQAPRTQCAPIQAIAVRSQWIVPRTQRAISLSLRARQARQSRLHAHSARPFKPLQSGRNGSCPALSGQA